MQTLENREIAHYHLTDNYMPESIQRILPIEVANKLNPDEQRAYVLRVMGLDFPQIGWFLGRDPEETADIKAKIENIFTDNEQAVVALSFRSLLDSISPVRIGGKSVDFTNREKEVFSLFAAGFNSFEIGDRLYISPKTAANHRCSVLESLGAKNKVEAIFLVFSTVPPDERERFFPLLKKLTLPEKLSSREEQILFYITRGKTSAEIGNQLNISQKTADNHRSRILGKIGRGSLPLTTTITLAQNFVSTQG